MTTSTAIGMMVAAGGPGSTHGIEPDHVAGISALTSGTKDSKLAAVIGACFAAGHRLTERLGPRVDTAMQVVVAGLVLIVALRLLWDDVPALLA